MPNVNIPDVNPRSFGSGLITAAIPLGGYALVDTFLYPDVNLFIFDGIAGFSGFIVAAGAAAFAHRTVKK